MVCAYGGIVGEYKVGEWPPWNGNVALEEKLRIKSKCQRTVEKEGKRRERGGVRERWWG